MIARISTIHLPALAPLRDRAGIRVAVVEDVAWVTWDGPDEPVVVCLRPIPSVVFLVERNGQWYRPQRRLPTAERPPADEGVPLAALLVPGRFEPLPPTGTMTALPLRIIRGGEPRPATAVRCSVAALAAWADTATTMALENAHAAWANDRVILLGTLPPIRDAVRYWGTDVLIPLGYTLAPALPDRVVRAAVGAGADDVVMFDGDGVDVIPRSAFALLTRAGVRLALAPPLRFGEGAGG